MSRAARWVSSFVPCDWASHASGLWREMCVAAVLGQLGWRRRILFAGCVVRPGLCGFAPGGAVSLCRLVGLFPVPP